MSNTLLYILTVLIWGTTWFSIKLQIPHAPPEISIFYRFILASLILVGWCGVRKISLKFRLVDHVYLLLLGISMCSIHHIFIYSASTYVASGVVAVIFSTVSFFNIFYNYLFYGAVPRWNVLCGVLMGILGLGIFFAPDFMDINIQNKTIQGIFFAGIGSMIFSFASVVTKRNQRENIQTLPAVTMASIYGACIMLAYMLIKKVPFVFPESAVYWSAVLYLTIFGSIVAFLCYLKLVRNVGAAMAGYAAILFPPVALFLSSLFENYQWHALHFLGLFLVLVGNVFVLWHKRPQPIP